MVADLLEHRQAVSQRCPVREALWLLYDFDWTNRVLFYDFYKTGVSFFQNSPMAHGGPPSEKELALLEPWREQIPPRVFTEEFRQPRSSGYGLQRHNFERALELFKEAGWKSSTAKCATWKPACRLP